MQSPNGRVAVVTGATSGIGRVVAERLAALKWTVVVVGRGEGRAVQAAGEIEKATGNPNVFPLPVSDLALRSEVRRVAAVLLDKYPRIHLLVNNAGGYFHRREVTSEGLERTFALNVVAPFLLTTLLADRLHDSSPARVVQVASEAHRGTSVDFTDLQSLRHYRGFRAYGRSKLELLLLTRELAHRLQGRGVTVVAVHPGFVASGFGRNNGRAIGYTIRFFASIFGTSVRRGADAVFRAATDPFLATANGEYILRGAVHPGSSESRDPVTALRLFGAVGELARAPA
jgi:NAD(P)-dependent dehydrogenase (short-subunit alcohol dehydrogenase family)